MTEALVGLILESLVSITINKVGQELNLVTGVDKDIESLTLSLQKIEALLEDAEQRQVQERSVGVWLSNLKEVSEAIEEALDEWSYEILKQQFVEKQGGEKGSDQNAPVHVAKKQQVCFQIPSPCCSSGVSRVVRHHGIAKKIRDLRERVDSIAAEGKTFQLQDSQSRPEQRYKLQETSSILDVSFGRGKEKENLVSRLLNDDGDDEQIRVLVPHIIPIKREETSSIPDVSFGREYEKDSLVSRLLNDDEQNRVLAPRIIPIESSEEHILPSGNPDVPSIISIVGMGGIGKTTLSQLVYNDREVKAHFDTKIWVCVPSPFEGIQILAAIYEALCDLNHPKANALETYSRSIYDSIQNKKFLIVLDGVWNPREEQLKQVIIALSAGAKGSKVLMTTRNENTACMMRAGYMTYIIHLKMLSEEDCEELFFYFARKGSRETMEPRMHEVGKEIVKKAQGLPLAAKTLGSLMHNKKTTEEWEDVLNSKMWTLKEFEQHVFTPLFLSYYDLAPKVRRCFLYCAIFPKGHLIDKFELICLWMSQDYLRAKEEPEDIYTVGEIYFNDLVMRSFFQDLKKDENGNIIGCKMHHTVHEFVQYLSKSEFLVLDVRRSKFKPPNENVRHMFLTFASEPCNNVYFPFAKLRTVIMDGEWVSGVTDLIKLKSLRALDLGRYWGAVPNDIGGLIHLRYLKLSHNPLDKLPETLCDLHHLQTLILYSCRSLGKLPDGMVKLIKLKHLDVRECVSLEKNGVEKLAAMRTLRLWV